MQGDCGCESAYGAGDFMSVTCAVGRMEKGLSRVTGMESWAHVSDGWNGGPIYAMHRGSLFVLRLGLHVRLQVLP